MSFTFDDFNKRFPELKLSIVNEPFYNEAKASAILSVNSVSWGAKTDEGVKLMTAHIITISKRGGVSGQVSMQKVGDLQRQFANPMGIDAPSTSYLADFQRMMKSLIISPIFIC